MELPRTLLARSGILPPRVRDTWDGAVGETGVRTEGPRGAA